MKKKPTKKKPELKQKCERAVPQVALTLRDWFAGQALQGLISNPRVYDRITNLEMSLREIADMLSRDAYRHADSMLVARLP